MDTKAPKFNPIPVVATWYHIGIDFVGPIYPWENVIVKVPCG